MKWSIVIALCIAIFGFIPLMGIPGAIALELGGAFAAVLFLAALLVTAMMESLARSGA